MSQDVNRLKELLFEEESRALSELNRRMDIVFERVGSPERFTGSVASVLDEALAQAETERHAEVAHAIAPLIVQTIKSEIRGSQDELAEALYPSLGRMVKAYVVSAIRDLMDEINRRLESNSFMLRLRSLLTGRPVAELAFVEGQRLRVEEIYLIRRGLGQLLGHWPAINGPTAQDQRVSGILTAINEVANEVFDADKAALRRIDLGTSLIYLRASPTHLLAAKCRGVAPPAVEKLIDDQFLATIERLRALFNGGEDTNVPTRAVRTLLADLSDSLETSIGEQHAKLSRRRTGLSPAVVLVWGIGLALAAWAAWSAYAGYQTARVRAIAAHVLANEPALAGYPVHAAVEHRGREVALTGLVPTTAAGQDALRGLRQALPGSEIVDRTTALPTADLDKARADISTLRSDLARARSDNAKSNATLRSDLERLGAERAKAEAALGDRVGGLETALKETDTALHGELKALAAQLAKANGDTEAGLGALRTGLSQAEIARRADLSALRSEIARAVAPSARAKLETWMGSHAVFFAKDTDYRDPQSTSAALDELAQLIKGTNVLVRVVGYTDEKGGEERNTPLSQARAQKVMADLSARGIPASRLVAVGRSDSADLSPVVGDASPNRRVEFEIGFMSEGGP
jgi:outer membrane protein OmpA-like peptidoglycan-associated protein